MVMRTPKQGEIYWLDTSPRAGHEQHGRRPYLVLSHNIVAKNSNVVTVVPISTTKRNYPLYVSLEMYPLKTKGKVLLDQMTTVDYHARSMERIEQAPRELMVDVLKRIKTIFQLESY